MAGLVVGLWVAFVRFSRDDRIRTPEDIEEMDVTLLGTIARTPRRESGRVTWPAFFSAGLDDRKGNSPWEILDNLRRALRAGAPAVLVVTSPGRGEGKSVFAANLGLALARSGRRVILVDGHLRRPVLKAMFSIPAGAWATGRPSPPKPRAVIRGLSVVSAAPPGTPAGLLHSRAAGQAIERWRHRADFVIIDAGPLLNAPDGIIWLPHADGALLVLRAGASRLGQLDDALELLERATTPVVGAVLNDVRPGRRQRG